MGAPGPESDLQAGGGLRSPGRAAVGLRLHLGFETLKRFHVWGGYLPLEWYQLSADTEGDWGLEGQVPP